MLEFWTVWRWVDGRNADSGELTAKVGGATAKVQFGTPTFEDGEVVVPKFWILQNTPCNFWKLHFKPWTKTFKSLQNKPFDLIF